jgi:hypothetical protein
MLIAGAHLSAKRVEPECDVLCSPVVEVAMLRVRRAILLLLSHQLQSSEDSATYAGEGPLEFSPRCLAMLTAL